MSSIVTLPRLWQKSSSSFVLYPSLSESPPLSLVNMTRKIFVNCPSYVWYLTQPFLAIRYCSHEVVIHIKNEDGRERFCLQLREFMICSIKFLNKFDSLSQLIGVEKKYSFYTAFWSQEANTQSMIVQHKASLCISMESRSQLKIFPCWQLLPSLFI